MKTTGRYLLELAQSLLDDDWRVALKISGSDGWHLSLGRGQHWVNILVTREMVDEQPGEDELARQMIALLDEGAERLQALENKPRKGAKRGRKKNASTG